MKPNLIKTLAFVCVAVLIFMADSTLESLAVAVAYLCGVVVGMD